MLWRKIAQHYDPVRWAKIKSLRANLDTRLLHGIRLEMPSDEKGTSALKNNNNSTNNN